MNRQGFLRATLGLGALAAVPALALPGGALAWRTRATLGFGTSLSMKAAHEDEATLDRALDAAVETLARINSQMSLFDEDSAVSRLNRDGVLKAPPAELVGVLRTAQAVSRASDGAFDVTVQPLWRVFAAAQTEGRLPDATEVAAARACVGWRGLDVSAQCVRLQRRGMGVTLNGIAQGYATDRVRAVLASHGIRHALVDAGEFAMLGRNEQGRPWTLGLASPRDEAAVIARLMNDGRCFATSADNVTTFSANRRHHHIFDPRTGYSPTGLASVTVAADSGAVADALTKVLFMAGAQRAAALARQWNADALWVDKSGRWQSTPGLHLASIGRALETRMKAA